MYKLILFAAVLVVISAYVTKKVKLQESSNKRVKSDLDLPDQEEILAKAKANAQELSKK
jgi:hypothetical protein